MGYIALIMELTLQKIILAPTINMCLNISLVREAQMDKQAKVKELTELIAPYLDKTYFQKDAPAIRKAEDIAMKLVRHGYIKVSPDGEQDVNKWKLSNQQFTGLALIPDLEREIDKFICDVCEGKVAGDCGEEAGTRCPKHRDALAKVSRYHHQLAGKMEVIDLETIEFFRLNDVPIECINCGRTVAKGQLQKCKEIVEG
jgi:hypothetical protein